MNAVGLQESTFTLIFDYKKDRDRPYYLFEAISNTLKSIQEVDNSLVGIIRPGYESVLVLDYIQANSPINIHIKSLLRKILPNTPELVEDKEANAYIADANAVIIESGNGKTTIQNMDELIPLEKTLYFPTMDVSPTPSQVLEYSKKLHSGIQNLDKEDKVQYRITNKPDRLVEFNKDFNIPDEKYETLSAARISTSEHDEYLVVKKPDLTGFSKWDFRLNGSIISAAVLDYDFLNKMHNEGKFSFTSGDGVNARLKTISKFDSRNRLIGQPTFEILKINRPVPRNPHEQLTLDSDQERK
jgi:hypothetical protein